jgi:hypothetical protein
MNRVSGMVAAALAIVAATVGGLAVGGWVLRGSSHVSTSSSASQSPATSPSMTAGLPTALPSASVTPSPLPSPRSWLTASPSTGPVGTQVVLRGQNCSNPPPSPGSQRPAAYLYFGNQGDHNGTVGVSDLPSPPVSADGGFELTATIPSVLHGYQGRGGGSVMPGTYVFGSLPPYCSALFTLTPS